MKTMTSKKQKKFYNELFFLEGKISKNVFKKIVKHYNWKIDFKTIHIVGTNGKGSNAKYINDELIKHKYKVGLFTSPHIEKVCERIKINDNNISFELLFNFYLKIKKDFNDIKFGFFDILFLCSLNWFCSQNIDIAIFEAGIGAKKDIVNYLNHNYLLITSIGLDHEKLLGNSLSKIAIDKSYAIKNNIETFIPNSIDKKIISIFKNKAKKTKCKITTVKVNSKTFEEINISLSKFFLKKIFDIKNFKSNFTLPRGRVEKIIINNINCYIDVSHNYQGIKETIKYFKLKNIKFKQCVLSLSNDKNTNKIIEILKKEFDTIYIYQNKGRKPLKYEDYNSDFDRIHNLKNFVKTINKETLFIGSFYLASELFEIRRIFQQKTK